MCRMRGIGLLILLTLVALFATHNAVAAQQLVRSREAALKLPPSLAARGDDSPVRVLIRVAAPFAPEGRLASRDAARAQRSVIGAAQATAAAAFVAAGASYVRPLHTVPWITVEATPSLLRTLAVRSDVVSIEEDRLARPALMQSVPLVHAPLRWEGGLDGRGWTVAVLDSGVARDHEFLAGKVVGEACFSSATSTSTSLCPSGASEATGAGSAAPCDVSLPGCGHGTHVAGIAAGRNHQSMGVAPQARLLAVQIFSRFDDPGWCGSVTPCILSYVSDQVRALEHVFLSAGQGNAARIASVNLSVAGPPAPATCDAEYAAVKDAVDQLASIGIPTVVSAGNDGRSDAVGAPACVSTAIAVGASTKNDELAMFSNRAAFLDLLAPGDGIVSSTPGSYSAMSGTSMAAPHVAGAWAIAKQYAPGAGVGEVLATLQAMASPIDDPVSGRRYARLDLATEARPDAPGVPGLPVASVQGSRVAVTWSPPATGTTTRYIVRAGTSPGGLELGAFDVGPSTAVAANLNAGTYFVRVAAANGPAIGPESPEASFTIAVSPPLLAPRHLAAAVNGRTVTLAWEPPQGVAVQEYVLVVGSVAGARDLLVAFTGAAGTGLQAMAPPGTYYVRIHARTAYGLSSASNEIVVTVF
jgi:subtilisin family serine protease